MTEAKGDVFLPKFLRNFDGGTESANADHFTAVTGQILKIISV